jgi:hypothetical protein
MTLRDRALVTHDKEPKSPINRTPSRQIFAQNRAKTLEALVVPSPRHYKPSPVEPVPRQPSTTATAPLDQSPMTSGPWSLPRRRPKLKPKPCHQVSCFSTPPLKNDPSELPAPLWLRRMKTQRVLLSGRLGLPSSDELQWSRHRGLPRCYRHWPEPWRTVQSEMNVQD